MPHIASYFWLPARIIFFFNQLQEKEKTFFENVIGISNPAPKCLINS